MTEASIRAIGPGPEAESQGKSRTAARQPAGEVAAVPERTRRRAGEDELEAELCAVIDQLELSELQKRCLRARWLDAIIWMERKAKQAQRLYYAFRLLIIIGGVIIPALVSLDLGTDRAELVRWATFGLSLLVASSAAIEGFFRYGERWRHYRSIVERLKIEGWQFFQLSGPYAQHRSHAPAHPEFAVRVEEIIRSDVHQYITEVVRERQAPAAQSSGQAGQAPNVLPSS